MQPHPGIPAFDLNHYCVWQGTRISVRQDLAGKLMGLVPWHIPISQSRTLTYVSIKSS
jgi:hypothetical protein